jgi:hypothetical protein
MYLGNWITPRVPAARPAKQFHVVARDHPLPLRVSDYVLDIAVGG